MEVIQIGNIVDDTNIGFKNPQRGRVYSSKGLSPCLNCCEGGGLEPKILENNAKTICLNSKVDGKQPSLEDRIYSIEGVMTACTTSFHPNIAIPQKGSKVAPTLCTSNELCVYEGIEQIGYVNDGKHQQDYVQGTNGVSRAVCAGSHASTPHLLKTQLPNYRIRKLTPRECFRLMGVSEENINTIQAAGISNSQQYKLAGNSIVVDVLYYIFKKMFVDKGNDNQELTLF